jgi:flagellar biosynthesis protein FlhG
MNGSNVAQKMQVKTKTTEIVNNLPNDGYNERLAFILGENKKTAAPAPKPKVVIPEPKTDPVKTTKVVAIGGSKGGIGKTSFTASLAMELSAQGKKIIAVDADFGDPDLKDWLGIKEPKITLDHFFKQHVSSLNDLVLDSPMANLQVICGDSQSMETSYPFYGLRLRFLKQLKTLNSDYTLLDLGPGISYNNIDNFLAADERILVMVPEPSSIISAFRFLRIAVLRHLKKSIRGYSTIIELINQYETPEWHNKFASINPLIKRVERINVEAAERMKRALLTFNTKIVLNMVMSNKEVIEGPLFAHALFYLLRIKSSFLGPVSYNKNFRSSSKEQRPFLILNDKAWKHHVGSKGLFSFLSGGFRREPSQDESIVKSIFGPLVPDWPDFQINKDFSHSFK